MVLLKWGALQEATFEVKEGDREQHLAKLKSQLASHEANLLKFDQQRFLTGEPETDSYNRLNPYFSQPLGESERSVTPSLLTIALALSI